MKLSLVERETILLYNQAEPTFNVFLGSSSSHVWIRLPAGNWPRRNSSHSFDTSCIMICLPSFCRKRHSDRKGRLPKRKPAFNGVLAHALFSLMVHSFPALSSGKHTTYHSVPVISSSFSHLLDGRLTLASLQPQGMISYLCDAQVCIAGDMGSHGRAGRRELEQRLGEL